MLYTSLAPGTGHRAPGRSSSVANHPIHSPVGATAKGAPHWTMA